MSSAPITLEPLFFLILHTIIQYTIIGYEKKTYKSQNMNNNYFV